MDWLTEEWARMAWLEAYEASSEFDDPHDKDVEMTLHIAKAAARQVVEWFGEAIQRDEYWDKVSERWQAEPYGRIDMEIVQALRQEVA